MGAFDMSRTIRIAVSIIILSFCVIYYPSLTQAQIEEFSSPDAVNKVVSIEDMPVIYPGETGILIIKLFNPFDENPYIQMRNISIEAEPYMLLLPNGKADWNDIVDSILLVNSSTNSSIAFLEYLDHFQYSNISWRIITSPQTPTGGWLSDAVYVLRFKLNFQYVNPITMTSENISYASRGFFSDEDWQVLYDPVNYSYNGDINITFLRECGYEGIIPDSSITIRSNLPIWPIVIFASISVISFIIGTYILLKENPFLAPTIIRIFSNIWKSTTRVFRYLLSLCRKI